jgi:mannose-6-phosphate isomerase class I
VKEKVASGKTLRPAPAKLGGTRNFRSELIAAPYFVVDLYDLKDALELNTADESGKTSVQILVAVEGCGVIEADGLEPVTVAKGDAVVIPAGIHSFRVRPQWTVELLKAYVPGVALPEPRTRL